MQTQSVGKSLRDVSYPMERLGEPQWRIYDLCRQGILPHVKVGPRRYKFDPDKLEQWIESGGSGLEEQK